MAIQLFLAPIHRHSALFSFFCTHEMNKTLHVAAAHLLSAFFLLLGLLCRFLLFLSGRPPFSSRVVAAGTHQRQQMLFLSLSIHVGFMLLFDLFLNLFFRYSALLCLFTAVTCTFLFSLLQQRNEFFCFQSLNRFGPHGVLLQQLRSNSENFY